MITQLIHVLKKAGVYVKNHPQVLFVLVLLIVFPLLFLYTGQQFLDVSKANQDRLQKDKMGLMHDVLSSLLIETNFNAEVGKREFERITTLNPDIVDYKVSKSIDTEIITIIAKNESDILKPELQTDLYRGASLRLNESFIFEGKDSGVRFWSVYTAILSNTGELYFIYTKNSLEKIDTLFATRERSAYFSLIFIYVFLIALAYWHIRLTDYRYLYIKAQKANEMKDLFTNMIAHELRAPLTAIKGYASMIVQKNISNDEKMYASRIQESSERLLAIVNDLLDVARIQSGKLSVALSDTSISGIVRSVIDELQISANEKEITLEHEGTEKDCVAMCDSKRLHQALTNLVSNSIKYTEKGTITISVEDTFAFVEIRVKDTGMGISADDQKKLFAPFFRVSSQSVSAITGTGLGMWITKQLIELMGAKIGVESIKNVGTQIVISFPKAIRIS